MNKLIPMGLVLAVIIGVIIIRLQTPEDTWLCQKGVWVQHGHPAAPKPTTPCISTKTSSTASPSIKTSNDLTQ